MANDAFALSPISARAALPSEDDYHAISDAFMETARGRWFLTEYARRNRNADTTMVLEAVARIEASIASQKQEPVVAGPTLAEAADTLRARVAQASAAAAAALERFSEGQGAAPKARGLRIIREVAWRLREVGYDSRICDILEAQADVIDADSGPQPTHELREAILGAFETLRDCVEELAAPGAGAPSATNASPQPAVESAATETSHPVDAPHETPRPEASLNEAPRDEVSQVGASEASLVEMAPAKPDDTIAEVVVDETVLEIAPEPVVELTDPTPPPDSEAAFAFPGAESQPIEATAANVQGAIAQRAAPAFEQDNAAFGEAGDAVTAALADTAPHEPAPPASEPVAAPPPEASTAADAMVDASPHAAASPQASPMPVNTLSLGESLLARGMVTAPAGKADPLAPIRRMSQAEKIAFFS